MKLLTVGDSFTYGEELSDTNNAWPNLLAKKINYELTNLARPGSGNTRMVRNCIEHAEDYDLIIIAWSHFARFELADQAGVYDIWPGCSKLPYNNYAPWRKKIIEYFTQYYADDYLFGQYLINILSLQNYLKAKNKKYLMLNSFRDNNYDYFYNIKNSTSNLVSQIDKNFYLGWPNETMMEWTYGTSQGPRGHFLEEGHKIVADKIYEHIRNFSWVS